MAYLKRCLSNYLRIDHERPILFGPAARGPLAELRSLAAEAADPRLVFLDGGPLVPETMFSMLARAAAAAGEDGFERLRVVADMDWLLPLRPTTAEIVAFELMPDRHAKALDATIVCAYRATSFDTDAIAGAVCVHPVDVGADEPPRFRLVAGETERGV